MFKVFNFFASLYRENMSLASLQIHLYDPGNLPIEVFTFHPHVAHAIVNLPLPHFT